MEFETDRIRFIQFVLCRFPVSPNIESIRNDPYWTSRKNSVELIELSSINKVSLVQIFSCSNIGSIRDDPFWTSRKNRLELIELSSINKVSLV